MKAYSQDELNEILRLHSLWEINDPSGVRAVLNDCCLSGLDLNRASLSGASLNCVSLNGASMNRAALDGASLNGVSLIGASLDGVSLNRASLIGASLDGASLNRAFLNGVTGNMREIKSAQFDRWPVAWTTAPDGIVTVQIGCQRRSLCWWKSADDNKISMLDPRALKWWHRYRDPVIGLVEASPAVPWGNLGGET